jgi:hypothetical protein
MYTTKVNEKFALYDFSASEPSKTEPKFDIGQFLSMFPLYKGIQ